MDEREILISFLGVKDSAQADVVTIPWEDDLGDNFNGSNSCSAHLAKWPDSNFNHISNQINN